MKDKLINTLLKREKANPKASKVIKGIRQLPWEAYQQLALDKEVTQHTEITRITRINNKN